MNAAHVFAIGCAALVVLTVGAKGCVDARHRHEEEMSRIRYARPAWCCPCLEPDRDGGRPLVRDPRCEGPACAVGGEP